ncbi:MAG: winged helix-turn-helix domain-containing protein [Solirubrobacterales bacterium]|nr:winged helix-turn-helix domain-containing protein [Solirubrobacterales bacterium]
MGKTAERSAILRGREMQVHRISDQRDDVDGNGDGAPRLEEIEQAAERRLLELQPMVEEAERLRTVLDVIAGKLRANGAGAERGDGGLVALGPPRAATGSNKRAILELVAERPGITASEIAEETGVKRTVVASTISRLKQRGELGEHAQGGLCVTEAAGR